MNPIRVLLAEDQSLVRGALVALPLLDAASALLCDVVRLDAIGADRAD